MAGRKLYNGWKNKPQRVCMYCGKPYAERHELFGGPNRQISIREHLQVDVCREHHEFLQMQLTDEAVKEVARLRAKAQREWMDKLIDTGITEQQALAAWMSMIGRNYREDMLPD